MSSHIYYPEQRESRYGFSYNQTVWYSCLHANLGYDSSESLMAWHYLPDENTTNAIKGSASQIFDLRHSLVVKLGEEMEE